MRVLVPVYPHQPWVLLEVLILDNLKCFIYEYFPLAFPFIPFSSFFEKTDVLNFS